MALCYVRLKLFSMGLLSEILSLSVNGVLYAGTCFLIVIEKQKGASILIDGYINSAHEVLGRWFG